MVSRFFIFVVSGFVILASAGCGSKARVYAVDRPRLDQANMGNAGYIGGEKKQDGPIAERSTRRIYVFEFDKKKKPEVTQDVKKVDVSSSSPSVAATGSEAIQPSKDKITVPYIGDDEPVTGQAVATGEAVSVAGMQYTVLKDDTLQKIAKKVYGSYGKWTKIYDANKEKIKNPNFVKPGTVIVIPSIE